jgi:hypothetical protein
MGSTAVVPENAMLMIPAGLRHKVRHNFEKVPGGVGGTAGKPRCVKLQKIVAGKLILGWSQEQISGWLKMDRRRSRDVASSNDFSVARTICPSGPSAKAISALN